VFKLCGSPKQQSKRDTWNRHQRELNETKSNREFHHQGAGIQKKQKSDLEKILADIRKSVKQTQGFWSRLSYAMCSNSANANSEEFVFFESANSEDEEQDFSTLNQKSSNSGVNKACWTGSGLGDYNKRVLENSYESQAKNPEVKFDQNDENETGFTKEQMFKLKKITNQLRLAYGGEDVEWWNRDIHRRDKTVVDFREGSGDDPDGGDGFEDDEDLSHEGSGDGDQYDDEEGSGDVEGSKNSGESSQTTSNKEEEWTPFTKEEIEAIEPSTSVPMRTTTSKPTPGDPKESFSVNLKASISTIIMSALLFIVL